MLQVAPRLVDEEAKMEVIPIGLLIGFVWEVLGQGDDEFLILGLATSSSSSKIYFILKIKFISTRGTSDP